MDEKIIENHYGNNDFTRTKRIRTSLQGLFSLPAEAEGSHIIVFPTMEVHSVQLKIEFPASLTD